MTRRPPRAALIALLCALALPAPVQAASPRGAAPSESELRAAARALVDAGVPGITVRYWDRRGRVEFATGVADRRAGRRMRPGLHHRIASQTKSFTAVAVLSLAAEGRLSLEDGVARWLPDLLPDGAGITIRDLLAMRSGIRDYVVPDPARVFAPLRDPSFAWRPLDLIRIGAGLPRELAPGTGYSYSNTNYLLLELIVERVTGRRFGAVLAERVLRPAGLRDTSFPTARRGLPRPFARGYRLGPRAGAVRDATRTSPSIAGASGGMVSTVGDVARFYRLLNAGRLLPRRELAQMRTPLSRLSPASTYGLGLFSLRVPGCGAGGWGHNGEILGFQSFALATRDGRRGVAMLLNASGPPSSLFELSGRALEAQQRLLRVLTCATGAGLRRR